MEDQYKSRITENRIIPVYFFERLDALTPIISTDINGDLEQSVADIFLIPRFGTSNKLIAIQHFQNSKIKSYLGALSDSFYYSYHSLEFSILCLDEIEKHFGINAKRQIVERDTYLNSLVFYMKLNLESSFINQFTLFDRIAQILNIYFNLKISEKDVHFNKLIERIRSKELNIFNRNGLDNTYLVKLLDTLSENPTFKDSKILRNDIAHKISKISQKFLELDVVDSNISLAKQCLELCCQAINNLFNLVISNKEKIHILYK